VHAIEVRVLAAAQRGGRHHDVPGVHAPQRGEVAGQPFVVGVEQGDPRLRGRLDAGVARA
jgi:hypothetical protein